MKEVKMFILAHCPHCKKAREMKDELFAKHPEYEKIPLRVIEENEEAEYAAKFDYHLVPTFYVGDIKMHEGIPTKEAVAKVFEEAYR